MTLSRFLLLILVLFVSNTVHASFNIRHEYKSNRQEHTSRMKVDHKFDSNVSVGLEVKFRSKDSQDFMKDVEAYAKEFSIAYDYTLSPQWRLSPGMPVETSNGNETYKPQLRLTYRPSWDKMLSLSGRYRLDIKPHETVNKFRHRLTFVAGYNFQKWAASYEGNVYYSDNSNYHLYNGDRKNWEQNFSFRYRAVGNWAPFFELGDISVSNQSDDRELRMRAGIRVSFK
ncbi:oligogalacturonate-specific porin KdgM family protein [Neiella marina]|uniref:Oligogalacturonate-specific porin KdgM family protein n=1 Tax=Neiella holothuriorum TaxID=2870530 RepID=A0ABS7EDY7_9GAMM|nr:oligogalacturonate-specific porin KdgM family protein [Neiella holothuriorum]MBW8190470.1 oligogalacturonate-specific porin KdgM family protein [Neiella holothuriorum]